MSCSERPMDKGTCTKIRQYTTYLIGMTKRLIFGAEGVRFFQSGDWVLPGHGKTRRPDDLPAEETFWLLASTLHDRMEAYYDEMLSRLSIDAAMFDALLEKHNPKVAHAMVRPSKSG